MSTPRGTKKKPAVPKRVDSRRFINPPDLNPFNIPDREILYKGADGFNYKIKLNKNKIKSVIHYILGKQEIDITNPCTLCNTFKTKVIFTKCKHKFCITCALKSNNCNICRAEISDVQKLLF